MSHFLFPGVEIIEKRNPRISRIFFIALMFICAEVWQIRPVYLISCPICLLFSHLVPLLSTPTPTRFSLLFSYACVAAPFTLRLSDIQHLASSHQTHSIQKTSALALIYTQKPAWLFPSHWRCSLILIPPSTGLAYLLLPRMTRYSLTHFPLLPSHESTGMRRGGTSVSRKYLPCTWATLYP